MRTVPDWRDLPPVPRRKPDSCEAIVEKGKRGRRKRTRFGDLSEISENTFGHCFHTPRKRPRRNTDHLGDDSKFTKHTGMKTPSNPDNSQFNANFVAHLPKDITSPISDSNTTFEDTDDDATHERSNREIREKCCIEPSNTDDSSDEEAVLRIIRRKKNHVKPLHLNNENVLSPHIVNPPVDKSLPSPGNASCAVPDNDEHDCDEETIRARRGTSVKSSHLTNSNSRSTTQFSNSPSQEFAPNQTESGETRFDQTSDSSDDETIIRRTRRRRRHKDASESGAHETRICTLPRGDCFSSSIDDEPHSESDRDSGKKRKATSPSVEKHAKRRRVTSSIKREHGKQRRRRETADLKPANESEMRPRKRSVYRAQRRRCAGQAINRAMGVPWYMLDEERRPYRLRSSSRNCAARCIYWTKTERRLFKVAKSPIHNRGLYALEDIPAFAPVIEYAGEVVTQVQSEIREWEYQSRHMDEVYMYQLRKGTTDVIDGTKRGGPAKFVNHSCEPNVVADEIKAGGTNRVWFFSLRPIRKHEEILVDYCLSYEPGDVKRPCMCGTRKCKKYLNYYGLTE